MDPIFAPRPTWAICDIWLQNHPGRLGSCPTYTTPNTYLKIVFQIFPDPHPLTTNFSSHEKITLRVPPLEYLFATRNIPFLAKNVSIRKDRKLFPFPPGSFKLTSLTETCFPTRKLRFLRTQRFTIQSLIFSHHHQKYLTIDLIHRNLIPSRNFPYQQGNNHSCQEPMFLIRQTFWSGQECHGFLSNLKVHFPIKKYPFK